MAEGYNATIEWGFWKFVRYIITAALIAATISWLATRYGNLDIIIWNYHMANLWLFIPETFLLISTFFILRWSRNSEKKKRQKKLRDIIGG